MHHQSRRGETAAGSSFLGASRLRSSLSSRLSSSRRTGERDLCQTGAASDRVSSQTRGGTRELTWRVQAVPCRGCLHDAGCGYERGRPCVPQLARQRN